MAFPDGWQRKCAIVIQAAQVAETLTDFPLLVTGDNLPSEIWANADDGGGDLRFSADDAGAVRLACEIVSFSTSGESAEIYVKVPSVSSAVNTTIYIWYNNTGQTQPAATDTYGSQAVWGSDYRTVWHFNQLPTDAANNSTANSNTITPNGGMDGGDLVDGLNLANSAWDLDGIDDYLTFLNSLSFDDPQTVHIRIYLTNINHLDGVLHGSNNNSGLRFNFTPMPPNIPGVELYKSNQSFGLLNTTEWLDLHMLRNSGNVSLFVNSVERAVYPGGDAASVSPLDGIGFDYLQTANRKPTMRVDEYRQLSAALSANQIASEYNNFSSPATFAIAGTPTAVSAFNPAWAKHSNQIIRAI